MLPQITMEARVAVEPELRFTPSGMAVTKMRCVATSRKKDDSGKWVDDKTCWLTVTTFGKSAENAAESYAKGDLIVVSGRLNQNDWEDKEGNKRSTYEVIADSLGAATTFRVIPHGAGKAERGAQNEADPWASAPADADQPPF